MGQEGSEPMAYKKPVMSVGDEFMAWAETYWRMEEKYSDAKEPQTGESAQYKVVKEIFIKKINDIIAERIIHYL